MSGSIEKFKLEEKIRLSFLKHRGNLQLVSEECNANYEYVKKICNKIKKRQQRDVSLWVSSTIAEYLLSGSEQRKSYLIEALNKELGRLDSKISMCCRSPVNINLWEGQEHYICQKCNNDCVLIVEESVNMSLVLKLIKQLKDEDALVCEFVTKLGFTNKENEQPQIVNKTTNYNVAMGVLSNEDQKLLQKASDLDPRTRESLRKNIEKQMIDAEFEPDKNEKPQ